MSVTRKKSFKTAITEDTVALLNGQKQGHAGKYGYYNGGGQLFADFIRNNARYHPYWAEKTLLEQQGKYIADDVNDTERVVVVGQGPSIMDKEWHIISHMPNLKQIDLIDISDKFNAAAANDLDKVKHLLPPGVVVKTQSRDFREVANQTLQAINPGNLVTTVICTGSLITNVDRPANSHYPEAETKADLRALTRLTGGHGHVIVGYDTNDEIFKLHAAYRDPHLENFYFNALEFMLNQSSGIVLKAQDGSDLPTTQQTLRSLFKFETRNQFDYTLRNYPHILKVAVPFYVQVDTGDGEHDLISVEGGKEMVMMNCYKPRPNRISTLAIESASGSKEFSVSAGFDRSNNGMITQMFHVTPRTLPVAMLPAPAITP